MRQAVTPVGDFWHGRRWRRGRASGLESPTGLPSSDGIESATDGPGAFAQGGIGKRTLIVEPTKFANAATVY